MISIIHKDFPVLAIDKGTQFTAALLAMPDMETSQWPRIILPGAHPEKQILAFLKKSSLPMPRLTLLCSMGETASHCAEAQDRCMERIKEWKMILRSTEGLPDSMLQKGHPMEDHAFLLSIERIFGNALGVDSGVAGVLAALGITPLQDRCWQEGVTIIWAGYSHIQVFLVYQGKIMGMYEQHTGLPQEVLLNDLSQLRLNWLPDEQVRACGGHGCVCGDLPAEAEGFRPTWILGPRRADFKNCGRLATFCGDDRFDRCFGLLLGSDGRFSS